MNKDECESAIRHLCSVWSSKTGIPQSAEQQPSFSAFYNWIEAEYPQLLRFRSRISVRNNVEMWFDDEFKQNWRN